MKWQRLREEKETSAESSNVKDSSEQDTGNKDEQEKSLNKDLASRSVNKEEQEFHRSFLAQQRAAMQKVLAENSERTLEALMQQMVNFQAKVMERQSEPRVQTNPMDDLLSPQFMNSFAEKSPSRDVEKEQSLKNSPSWKAEKEQVVKNGRFQRLKVADPVTFAVAPQDVKADTPELVGKSSTALNADLKASIKIGKASKPYVPEWNTPLRKGDTASSTMRSYRKKTIFHHEHKLEDPSHKGVFADAEAIKAKLRKEMAAPEYDVTDFYKKSGCCQHVARSEFFENLTLFVIAFNAIWIAVDVDLNDATLLVDADPVFQVVDNFFCTYFLTEWLFRFASFQRKKDCLKDAWFVFDSFMCTLMLLETWVLTVLILAFSTRGAGEMGDASLLKAFRLVRLVRMARVIRLLHALPELMVVIKGMAVATRAVSCTVALMLLIIYVFAVIFRQLTDGSPLGTKFFSSVPTTMRFLLLHGAVPDLAEITVEIWDGGILYAILFLGFILVVTITVMNMLVGVLVGVVSTVATVEKEQLTVNFVKENLLMILKGVQCSDKDENGRISKHEFGELLQNMDAIRAFDMMGVDVVGLVDLADFIFADGKELTFGDFMEIIMQLRGTNQATVKDIVDLRKYFHMELKCLVSNDMTHFFGAPSPQQTSLCNKAGDKPLQIVECTGTSEAESMPVAPVAAPPSPEPSVDNLSLPAPLKTIRDDIEDETLPDHNGRKPRVKKSKTKSQSKAI